MFVIKRLRRLPALILAVLLSACACTPAAPAVQDAADIFFENGTVYTVDAQDTIAEVLAVKGEKIVFVGSAQEGQAYKGPATEVVDLGGGMLLPGFIDSHIHSVTMDFFDFVLYGILDEEEAYEIMREYITAHPEQEAYLGFGFMPNMFEGEELEKGPKKERLDAICPDKPLAVYSFDGHAAWLNSKFLELSGITKDTPAPKGGAIIKDAATGELWGTLADSALSLMPDLDMGGRLIPALMEFQTVLNALGYTSIAVYPGNGYMPLPLDEYQKLDREGALTLRVSASGIVTNWNTEEDIGKLAALKETYGGELLRVNAAKFFLDGVMDNQSAYLLEPYEGEEEYRGERGWDAEELNAAVAAVNTIGIQAHAHAIGDGAARLALDAMEYARDNTPADDYRNSITHLQLVAKEDIARFAALGVIGVAQPYWHFREPGYWEEVEYAVLGERAKMQYPMRSFLDAGVILACASDYPVTDVPNPFFAIEAGVTRNLPDLSMIDIEGLEDITDMDDPRCLLWPEERVRVQDMIRSFTASGAYAMFMEKETGTLEAGKAADLIIIDQDLLKIDPLSISDTLVLQTYLQGELVYSAE